MTGEVGTPAWHYDGLSAIRHQVHIRLTADLLHIEETGEDVPIAVLQPRGDRSIHTYGRSDRPGWRLELAAPADPAVIALLPKQEKHGALIDRFGLAPVMIVGAFLSVIVLMLLGLGSRIAAQAVPVSWEIALGDTLSGGMKQGMCDGGGSRAALDRLLARLQPNGAPVRVAIVDMPVANAVSLPGRQILLFRGLIEQAQSADEVAGVLAHEIGHVERRDPLVALIRGYGLSLMIGGVDGGAAMQMLVGNRYSRGDERGADAAALALLQRSHISPRATAAFFQRLRREEPGTAAVGWAATFLSTHPLSAERQQTFAKAPATGAQPALTPPEWAALKGACGH